jgi:hypothetical protein
MKNDNTDQNKVQFEWNAVGDIEHRADDGQIDIATILETRKVEDFIEGKFRNIRRKMLIRKCPKETNTDKNFHIKNL